MRQLWITYGIFGQARLLADVIYSRLRFPAARLVRRPIYIRGRKYLILGRGLTTGTGNRIDAFPRFHNSGAILLIGRNVQINDHCHFAAIEHLHIGDDSLIASRVFISDHNHGRFDSDRSEFAPDVPPAKRPLTSSPVNIGKRVWIGEGVIILPGVTIGDGAVIGGGAVVNRDIPENCVAVGNPAKVVRRFDRTQQRWEKYAA
jgi:lipopolysaccharide O-acetyltransferase